MRVRLFLFIAACLTSARLVVAQPALQWESGFENGFPGEWLDYRGGYSPVGTLPEGQVSAWTIVDRGSGEPVFDGEHSYKGWITDTAASNHRAYPVLHCDIQTPLVNSFMVYLDADFSQMARKDWIHLATWGNFDPTSKSGRWALHTLSVRDGRLGFAHTEPFAGRYVGHGPQEAFPLRQWVRITAYIDYRGPEGDVKVWQDGVPVLEAKVKSLAEYPGMKLRTAHWGMYANGGVAKGVQYNDRIRICTVTRGDQIPGAEPAC